MRRVRVQQWGAMFLASILLAQFSGCSTVPISGRRQFNVISSQQASQLGLAAFQQMKQELPISKDPAANALVQKVGKKIAEVAGSDLGDVNWEFVVFESEQANAFCLPGGKVGVYTGILPITKDEAGLATVIGHEVAHAVANHGAERMSEALVMEAGGQVAGIALSGSDPRVQSAVALGYGLGTQFGRALPHGRAQESEADYLGLIYMARAGYNPEAAIGFWQRFGQASGDDGPPAFFRTHPVNETRIRDLNAKMPEAKAEFFRIHPR